MANEPEILESLHKESEKINKGLDALFFELGKEAYAELRDKEAPNNEVELLVGRITALNKRIERIEETIQSVQKESLERARASSTYACPLCGSEVLGSDGFCMSCGTKLDRHCSNCGAPLGPEDVFCISCGTKCDVVSKEEDGKSPMGSELEDVPEGPVCKSCGHRLKPSDAFCKECGAKVS